MLTRVKKVSGFPFLRQQNHPDTFSRPAHNDKNGYEFQAASTRLLPSGALKRRSVAEEVANGESLKG